MTDTDKTYLGDSVYVQRDDDGFILTTENGYATDPSNEIFIEPPVYAALVAWVAAHEHDAHTKETSR